MSRSIIMPASLPSISPEWMPHCHSSVGLFDFLSASGVKWPSFDAMTIQMSRPWGLLPSEIIFSVCGEASTSLRSHATVSS
jgi:hypothetical protein